MGVAGVGWEAAGGGPAAQSHLRWGSLGRLHECPGGHLRRLRLVVLRRRRAVLLLLLLLRRCLLRRRWLLLMVLLLHVWWRGPLVVGPRVFEAE